jgi:PAS domain S-box-containing protein
LAKRSLQYQKLLDENKDLQIRLAQAESTLAAIRNGQVDTLFVSEAGDVQIYSAEESGRIYRMMLEAMPEGAAALTLDGLILYANQRLAELLGRPLEKVQGAWLSQFLSPTDAMRFRHLLEQEAVSNKQLEASLLLPGGGRLPVHLTYGIAQVHDTSTVVLVVSDQTEHQQLEQALRDSEALYRTLVESSEASIAILDRNGVYLFANGRLAERLDRSPDDIVGMSMEDFFPPEPARRQLEHIRAVLDSQQGQVYESVTTILGQPRFYRTSVQPIQGASGRAVLALIHAVDITDAWLAKEEVAASAARYQNLFEHMPVALIELNVSAFQELADRLHLKDDAQIIAYSSQQPEFINQVVESIRVEDANQAALDLFAAQTKLDLIHHWSVLVEPDKLVTMIASVYGLIEQQKMLTFETIMPTFAGTHKNIQAILEFEERGQENYLLAAFTDITQQKQAEQALQAQSEQFRALAENSPDVISRFDRNYRLLYINRMMFNAQLGRNAAQVGESLDTIGRSPEDIDQRKRLIDQVFQTGQPARLEFSFPGKDGLAWFDGRFVPEFAPDGSVTSVLVISRDITVLKQSQLALQKLNRAQQMINECSSVLVHAQDEGELLNEICRLIVESGGYRMAWVGLAENDPEQSVLPAAVYGFNEGYVEAANISWADNERGGGPTGVTIREGILQVNQNFATNPRMAPWREKALKRGYQSSLTLPLKNSQTTFGALSLYSAMPEAFDEDEANLLSQLADDLSFGLTALRERQELTRTREIARRWENIFEHAKWGVVVSSSDGRSLDLMNPEFAAMHGYAIEELEGKSILDIFAADERAGVPEHIRQAHETGHHVYESVHLRKDGTTFPAVVDITAVKDENGQVLYRVVNVRDISERKRMEINLQQANQSLEEKVAARTAELDASEQRFKLALKNAPVTVAAQDKDLRFIWAYNQRTQDPASVLGKTDADIFPPETAAVLLPLKRHVLETGEEVRQQLWVESAGQRLFLDLFLEPMRDEASQICGVGIATVNLTRFKEAEEALRLSERRFRLLAEQTPDHLLVQDLDLRYILVVNPQLGLTEADMLGKTDFDFLPPEEAEKLTRIKRQVLETGEPVHLEVPLSSLEGEQGVFEGSYFPRHNEQNRIDGLVGYFRNVTEQKRLEERLLKRQVELEGRLEECQAALDNLSRESKDAAPPG